MPANESDGRVDANPKLKLEFPSDGRSTKPRESRLETRPPLEGNEPAEVIKPKLLGLVNAGREDGRVEILEERERVLMLVLR